MSTKVELAKIMKLFSIFTSKKWIEIDGHDEILKNFGELMETMDENQVNLLLELTERYMWFSYNDYHSELRKILIRLYEQVLTLKKTLYIFPIIKPENENETKSGHAVMYMLNGIKTSLPQYHDIKIETLNLFEDLKSENLQLGEDDYLILVDDFIGSGNTLESTLKKIAENESIQNKFSIASVVIQEETINSLTERNIHFVYGRTMQKGISSYYEEPIVSAKKEIMTKIEDRIQKVKEYRFGYEKSEALVSMIRTPNNTFPIFWKEFTYKGKVIKAPFSRY